MTSAVQFSSAVLPLSSGSAAVVQADSTDIRYRSLQARDFEEVKAAHAALFPIDYEDNFFHRATNGLDRIWSCAAVSTEPYGQERVIGFITAKSVFLHEVDASDRQHMGLLSAVLDHDRVLYIMTLGVVEGSRHRGIASTLISIACQHAYETRCRAVFLHVITYNTAAMSLYSRQGFNCVAKLSAFYWIATGRTPDPHQQVYDAYLFVLYVGGAAGVPSPWDLVSLAWSPLRLAFNRIHACMPGFCRPEQPPQQQQFLSSGPGAQAWEDNTSSSSNTAYGPQASSSQSSYQPAQQQQQHHPQLLQPTQQQWQSDVCHNWQHGSRQRHRGPSLPGRQPGQHQHQQHHQQPHLHQQPHHHQHYRQHPYQGHAEAQMQQQPPQLQQQPPQQYPADALEQQQYALHQAMQPPQQRMLRWLFNGTTRGSSGVVAAVEEQPHHQQLQQPVPAVRQQWQDSGAAQQHKKS